MEVLREQEEVGEKENGGVREEVGGMENRGVREEKVGVMENGGVQGTVKLM